MEFHFIHMSGPSFYSFEQAELEKVGTAAVSGRIKLRSERWWMSDADCAGGGSRVPGQSPLTHPAEVAPLNGTPDGDRWLRELA